MFSIYYTCVLCNIHVYSCVSMSMYMYLNMYIHCIICIHCICIIIVLMHVIACTITYLWKHNIIHLCIYVVVGIIIVIAFPDHCTY